MALKLENINNLISDDLDKRNENWTEIDTTFGLKADKLLATNLVTNGDFSQGTTGWTTGGPGTTISVVDGEMNLLSASNSGTVRRVVSVTANNKYYLKAKVKTTTGSVLMAMYDGTELLLSPYIPKKGEYINFSHIFNITRTSTAGQIQPARDTREGGYDTIYLDDVVFINLTQTFGAGNEPTKEQMDRLLSEFPNSYFNGTQELLPLKVVNQLLDEKANKQQEEWITPTLLNGATGTIQYRKNSNGRLEFKGTLSSSTISNAAFIMPIGYRVENETRIIVGCADTTSGFLAFLSGGAVYVLTANKVFQMGSVTLI